ncbi:MULTISPECIES: D-alanyl-D-alanine carboxypeptidase/D-alanyl-D-alanine-endopeptidase [unclassified Yoonia]|uniref:D-alanyl-D-alanine carboxypeptidase/D-alanyl-D-alanine endopeptidase n=1 Tax=unclassified Yoonia TaxID=2629118 RepID=UPI002AFF943A|nr:MULTISPECIES: D-alanyl-D-alanine carboxypeptidase/D-alanyl-D-alanine-endopeptidase [unclassified Yoonia]
MRLNRRQMLAGAIATLGTSAGAEAPLRSYRPVARTAPRDALEGIIARAGLAGQVGVVLGDPATGRVLESYNARTSLPPASVTKAVTAVYALETLGAGHLFTTRVLAQGALNGGILEGNLILAGGGDPDLVTDNLADLVQTLHAAGLREVRGDFLIWDAALPKVDQIDPTQLPTAGYNPTIGGLNLNYNRVHFEWRREGGNVLTALDARSDNHRPPVTVARMQIVDRDVPVFTHAREGDVDAWTVARSALNDNGSRWLPVRSPALYAAEVFANFARSRGIVLGAPRIIASLPATVELARLDSKPMPALLTDMLRYSTNITAEALGLTASSRVGSLPRDLATSAQGMSVWTAQRAQGTAPVFVDHSGLGDGSRISAADMVAFLQARDVMPRLRPLLRTIALVDGNQNPIRAGQAAVQAKTGTLNFVTALAGYLRSAGGRDLSFAIFAADLDTRARTRNLSDEVPPGARSWATRARRLQQDILQQWALRAY